MVCTSHYKCCDIKKRCVIHTEYCVWLTGRWCVLHAIWCAFNTIQFWCELHASFGVAIVVTISHLTWCELHTFSFTVYIPYADVTFMVITETIEPSYCYSPKLNILPPMRVDMIIQGV